MSNLASRHFKKSGALRNTLLEKDTLQEIRLYLEGCLCSPPEWLSQEEANAIAENRNALFHDSLMEKLDREGKSRGAKYIAARILSGADPDLRELARDCYAQRNIKRALADLGIKGIAPYELRMKGIHYYWEARRFLEVYQEVKVPDRVWGSCYQVNQQVVLRVACTPNYNRLPMWVKKVLIRSKNVEFGDRIGDIWRLIPCAKAWKWSPNLPKKVAERIGKMSVRHRICAGLAWQYGKLRESYWQRLDREEIVNKFWIEWQKWCQSTDLKIVEAYEKVSGEKFSLTVLETLTGLPHGFVKSLGSKSQRSFDLLKEYASPSQSCLSLFGVTGKATIAALKKSNTNNVHWASAIAQSNPDIVQKILSMDFCIDYQEEVVDFMLSLPMRSRLRLLQQTHFRYRGEDAPLSPDHIRDTGYLWNQFEEKPVLGRVRCWFSAHEFLSAEYIKILPNEPLPIHPKWKRLQGLCAINGKWELEFPRRVATLKYWGKIQSNCIGGYGNAIKSQRSVIFAVREQGTITHCCEFSVEGDRRQFYKKGNSLSDEAIEESVCLAIRQALK